MTLTASAIPAMPRWSRKKMVTIKASGSPKVAHALPAMQRLATSSAGLRPKRSEMKGTATLAMKAASPDAPRIAPIVGSDSL
jgi:hypothetical protein